jgi:hypothetical protein
MGSTPEDIKGIFAELNTEVIWLHARWKIYRQLFAASSKRIDLLNECAATFFFVIQDVLIGEVQIMLCKLTDPPDNGKKENLSLKRLQVGIEGLGVSVLTQTTMNILNSLDAQCAPFRKWRNKRLAHLDLSTMLAGNASPLPGISRQMIEDALQLVRDYMNTIHEHYKEPETLYEAFGMVTTDGDALVALLEPGLRYEELRQKEIIPLMTNGELNIEMHKYSANR